MVCKCRPFDVGARLVAAAVIFIGAFRANAEERGVTNAANAAPESERPGQVLFLGWPEPRDEFQGAGGEHVTLTAPTQFWNVKGELASEKDVRRARLVVGFMMAWNTEESLRPLVIVLRADPDIEGWKADTAVIDAKGERHTSGSTSNATSLSAQVSLSPWLVRRSSKLPDSIPLFRLNSRLTSNEADVRKESLAEWPETISIEVRYPLENPQFVRRIVEIPEEPIHIAEGVDWMFESRKDRLNELHVWRDGPACLIRYLKNQGDWETHPYRIRTYLRGQQNYVEWNSRSSDGTRRLDFVDGVKARNDVEKIEVWRQRVATERIDNVRLRIDLLDEKNAAE